MTDRAKPLLYAAIEPRADRWTRIRLAWRRDRTAELLEVAELLHQVGAGRSPAAVELAALLHDVIQQQVDTHGPAACFPNEATL